MDAGTLSIKDIFGPDRRLIVPLFQRPYVWTRELQWEPLWDDIRSVAPPDYIAAKRFLTNLAYEARQNPDAGILGMAR